MYRGIEWRQVAEALLSEMRWGWMLLSLPFGVAAQVLRALRWRQALEPLGERPRRSVCTNAVFLSYASSLVVPRIGELLRCGVLRRWEGTSLPHSVGTVVTERVVDMLIMLLLSAVTILSQIPVFARFVSTTGLSLSTILGGFSRAGYLVTAVCALLALGVAVYFCRRFRLLRGAHKAWRNLLDGLLSIRRIRGKTLFIAYSLGIWAAYFLHFWLTFYCFASTESLGLGAALVAFVVGTYAVLVPTPNGAGAWHFAVKTVLMLYGVAQAEGAMFVLIVHSIQTLLVVALGIYALIALLCITKHPQ